MLVEASLLYLGAALSWLRPVWPLTTAILVAAYAWGLMLGFVQPVGIMAIAVMMLLALLCSQIPDGTRGMALHGLFLGSFRILGAGARVRRPRSCCFQNSVTQQLKPGAATHGPLDRLQATDLSLDRPRAPRQ